MIRPYPIGYHTAALREGRHCEIGDLDKGVLTERLEYLAETYAQQAAPTVELREILRALLVIGHHMGAARGRTTFPMLPSILEIYGTSLNDFEPAVDELQRANLFGYRYFEDDDAPLGHFGISTFGGVQDEGFITEIRTPADQARDIPDGAFVTAMTMIVFGNEEGRVFNHYTPFINSRPNGDELFMTIDFVIAEGEHAGHYVSRHIPLGSRAAWDSKMHSEPKEYRQIANSAFNVFTFDDSTEANDLRDAMTVDFNDTFWSLQGKVVVIEVGLSTDGSGINYLKSIVQPEHPNYIEVMDLGAGISAGSGVFGEYVSSAAPSSIGGS